MDECALTRKLLPRFNRIFAETGDEERMVFGDFIEKADNHPVACNAHVVQQLRDLVAELPLENYVFLANFLPHLHRVARLHKTNKMGFKNLLVVWTPTLNFGSALLVTLIVQAATLFPLPRLEPQASQSEADNLHNTSRNASGESLVPSRRSSSLTDDLRKLPTKD